MYMVRKINIVEVYKNPEANGEANDEIEPASGEETISQSSDTEPTVEPIEAKESEHEPKSERSKSQPGSLKIKY